MTSGAFTPSGSTETIRTRRKKQVNAGNIVAAVILLLGAVTMIFPLFWMITVALKSNSAVYEVPPQWFPKEFDWSNFSKGIAAVKFWSRFANTMIIALTTVVGAVISNVLVGYALARVKFVGRKLWFYLTVGSMMLPGLVGMLPLFSLYHKLGWYNTWLPLIVPAFLGGPFFTFLIRQFMMGIPRSYDEAARIDGANHFQILWQVLIPMIRPALVVIVIYQFQGAWNDYLNPLVYVVDPNKWTLSLAIAQFISQWRVEWNQFMAVDLIYMLPTLILFFAGQKYFMNGLGSLNNAGLK